MEDRDWEEMLPGDEEPFGGEVTGEGLCPDCGGTGEVEGTTCENCAGTGVVIEGIGGG